MNNLSFYIIFHKKLYPKNVPGLPCFIYLGANEYIKKEIDTSILHHRLKFEYDCLGYNPIYQMLKFQDNSVILNYPAPPTPFVGFSQYDMIIDKDKFILAQSYLKDNIMVGFFPYSIQVTMDILQESQWNQVLEIYNQNNNTTHTVQDISTQPFFLMNTYILPSWFFTRLQLNLRKLLPTIFRALNYNMRHIAGTLERANSFIIACGIKEGIIEYIISDAISDDRSLTLHDELLHS